MALIYSGAVEVRACDMRAFVQAAKFLKLQGFENINPTVSADDIRGPDQYQPRRNFSIRLKRIDESEFAMDSTDDRNDERFDTTTNQPVMTNGGHPADGNDSNESGNGTGSSNVNAETDDGASNGVGSYVDVENGSTIVENGVQLSSSSDSDTDSPGSASESELSG